MRGSILRCGHEKLYDPRDVMLSGNQYGPDGELFVAPFTHGKNFHLGRLVRHTPSNVYPISAASRKGSDFSACQQLLTGEQQGPSSSGFRFDDDSKHVGS